MQQSDRGQMYFQRGLPAVCQHDHTFSGNDRHHLKLVSLAQDIEAQASTRLRIF